MSYYIIARLETALEDDAPPGKFGNRESLKFDFLHYWGRLYRISKIVKYMKRMIFHDIFHVGYIENKNFTFVFIENLAKAKLVLYMHRRSCSKLRHSVGFTICLLTICDHLLISFRHIACTNDHLFWIKSGPTTDINTIMMISTSPHIYLLYVYVYYKHVYIVLHCIELHAALYCTAQNCAGSV